MSKNSGVRSGYNNGSLHDEIKFTVNSPLQNHVCIFRRVTLENAKDLLRPP